MSTLHTSLFRANKNNLEWQPRIFDLSKTKDRSTVKLLLRTKKILHVVDDYREQQLEYFQVTHPSLVYQPEFPRRFDTYWKSLGKKEDILEHGRWVFYPWNGTLVHILKDADFQLVRTARNRNLITEEEQENFYNAVVGLAGLSVGNSVAQALILQGGARHIRIADNDRLALSNLNRIRASVEDLGSLKAHMAARQIYTLNPYAKVELFTEGLTKQNIGKFFAGPPKLDIMIDEIDNLAMKYLIREQAKKYKLAVVMAADNGDNAVVDVERYDLKPQPQFFHGRIGKTSYEKLSKLDKFGIGKTITQHVGPENVTERMQQSLLEMGKTIVSWPQLGGAALINGSAVAYAVRKILNKQPLEHNRALVSLDEKLIPGYDSPTQQKHRRDVSNRFKKVFGL